jgi:DNA replication protein DnaC
MSDTLMQHYLKNLRLPTFLKEYKQTGQACLEEGASYTDYLKRLSEKEYVNRQDKAIQHKIKKARFPTLKTLDMFNFKALPGLNKALILDLNRGDYIPACENVLALGNSGTGKTHLAIALGYAACQQNRSVYFTQAAQLVHQLIEAREERELLRFKKKLLAYDVLIIDELGFVPFSKSGAELLFDIFSGRYEQGSTIVTSNLPFEQWTEVFGCERLTGALLDRLTHHVHILEMNGDSYRLNKAKEEKEDKKTRK